MLCFSNFLASQYIECISATTCFQQNARKVFLCRGPSLQETPLIHGVALHGFTVSQSQLRSKEYNPAS